MPPQPPHADDDAVIDILMMDAFWNTRVISGSSQKDLCKRCLASQLQSANTTSSVVMHLQIIQVMLGVY